MWYEAIYELEYGNFYYATKPRVPEETLEFTCVICFSSLTPLNLIITFETVKGSNVFIIFRHMAGNFPRKTKSFRLIVIYHWFYFNTVFFDRYFHRYLLNVSHSLSITVTVNYVTYAINLQILCKQRKYYEI